jgi:hypothetical protein
MYRRRAWPRVPTAVPGRLIALAWEEYRRSREPGDPDRQLALRRQAAEKAWVHVTENADRALGVRELGPSAHAARERRIRDLGRPELWLAYVEVREGLHGDCFYQGRCPPERVEELLRAAERLPALLDEAARRHRP